MEERYHPTSVIGEQMYTRPRLVAPPPAECLDLVSVHMTQNGFSLAERTEGSVAFSRPGGADPGVGCVLMFLFLVPGILYFAFAKGAPVRTAVLAVPEGEKTRLYVSGEDLEGKVTAGKFFASLPD